RFESHTGDDTIDTATSFRSAAQVTARLAAGEDRPIDPLTVAADLTTAADVDVYSYRPEEESGFTVQLRTSDRSVLSARLSVLDDQGHLVATVEPPDLFHGDLSLHVAARAHQRFFYRVEADHAGVFGVGAYQLQVVPDGRTPAPIGVEFPDE